MASFTPVLITEFYQPDETMPFGKQLVQIVRELRIALPTITRTLIKALSTDPRWKIEVHIPGRTFRNITEPIDFQIVFPTWTLGRNIAVHRALGCIREEYKDELFGSDLTMVSRKTADGEIVRTRNDDSILSFVQDLEVHIRTLEIQTRRSTKTAKKLMTREVELEDDFREARYEHEDEVKDLLERIKNLKLYIATLEEKMDQGEDLHPNDVNGPFLSNDDDYEESTNGGGANMEF